MRRISAGVRARLKIMTSSMIPSKEYGDGLPKLPIVIQFKGFSTRLVISLRPINFEFMYKQVSVSLPIATTKYHLLF